MKTASFFLRAAGGVALFLLVAFIMQSSTIPARAMPEYATRTGEPCASCHVSPAGGGLRSLRGQAWVMAEKPDTVPSTIQALEILGIQLPADTSLYSAAPSIIPTPMPLSIQPETRPLFPGLWDLRGN